MEYAHTTKKKIESVNFPGVSFTLRAVSYGRRKRIAEKVRALWEQKNLSNVDLGRLDTVPTGETLKVVGAISDIDRIYFDEMLVGVRGLVVDAKSFDGVLESPQPAALDDFLEMAPEGLVAEISRAIVKEMAPLTEQEQKNSAPPSGPLPGGGREPALVQ